VASDDGTTRDAQCGVESSSATRTGAARGGINDEHLRAIAGAPCIDVENRAGVGRERHDQSIQR
jgi:hypothetical protein